MLEEWKDIDGYENYMISNLGRVKSLNYNRTGKERVLKCLVDKDGYLFVRLCKNGKPKTFKVHRLVAQEFIPNPENKPCVDHINTIKNDNRSENLRWCTVKENNNNELTKKNHSLANKGKTPWNKGVSMSEEQKQKIASSKKGKHWKLENGKRVWY